MPPPPTSNTESSAASSHAETHPSQRSRHIVTHNSKKAVSEQPNIPSSSTPSTKLVLKIPPCSCNKTQLNEASAPPPLTMGEPSPSEPPWSSEASKQASGNCNAAGEPIHLDPPPNNAEASKPELDAAPAPPPQPPQAIPVALKCCQTLRLVSRVMASSLMSVLVPTAFMYKC
jgi:hypothetical protein